MSRMSIIRPADREAAARLARDLLEQPVEWALKIEAAKVIALIDIGEQIDSLASQSFTIDVRRGKK